MTFEKNTTAELLYTQIRQDIISLRLKPGQKLSEAQLARQYAVSRTPVKNAFVRLAAEGLVTILPQVGTIVAAIDLQRVRDICGVRLLLESHAAAIAATCITDAHIAEIERRCLARPTDGTPEQRRRRCFAADEFLHDLIYRLCGNAELTRIIASYRSELHRVRAANANWQDRLARSEREMQAIAQALQARDSDRARRAMQQHIEQIQQTAEQSLSLAGSAPR
jgi:DNA-binding GntR family transcriptional regulator